MKKVIITIIIIIIINVLLLLLLLLVAVAAAAAAALAVLIQRSCISRIFQVNSFNIQENRDFNLFPMVDSVQ
jgi:hypothetical protein